MKKALTLLVLCLLLPVQANSADKPLEKLAEVSAFDRDVLEQNQRYVTVDLYADEQGNTHVVFRSRLYDVRLVLSDQERRKLVKVFKDFEQWDEEAGEKKTTYNKAVADFPRNGPQGRHGLTVAFTTEPAVFGNESHLVFVVEDYEFPRLRLVVTLQESVVRDWLEVLEK